MFENQEAGQETNILGDGKQSNPCMSKAMIRLLRMASLQGGPTESGIRDNRIHLPG
jgi:hypothetical protein